MGTGKLFGQRGCGGARRGQMVVALCYRNYNELKAFGPSDCWNSPEDTFKSTRHRMLNIVINMPSLFQVTLNSYSFENVAFHVLHERIPLYTFRTLSDWWDQRTSLNRWRTVDHCVRRCRDNVRILESVDFIGRTSELARLFGILFFSVICRGSQVFLKFIDLRFSWPYIHFCYTVVRWKTFRLVSLLLIIEFYVDCEQVSFFPLRFPCVS